jgi:galactokinase
MTGFIEVEAPGRVNLIGDHTDHTGGLVMPMAIDLSTTLFGDLGGDVVSIRSALESAPAEVPIDLTDPSQVRPSWARYVAGVVAEVQPARGFRGHLSTTLPVGGGLSSSAALEVAVALALGAPADDPVALALLCQRAEQRSVGVPCGIMDQLACTAGVAGHALLIDCSSLAIEPVALPDDLAVLVFDSGEERSLATTAYGERRSQCEAAEAIIGPLRTAELGSLDKIDDEVVRRRARHVITENQRVRDFADALRRADYVTAGALLYASHESLRDDFEVSTPILNNLVRALRETPGVFGARLTGAGFGGCVVAITEPGAVPWTTPLRASAGARVIRQS